MLRCAGTIRLETPGIRTLSEGYAYPALFLALGALAVTLPGLLGNTPLLGDLQPYLYGWLLILSLWVAVTTAFHFFDRAPLPTAHYGHIGGRQGLCHVRGADRRDFLQGEATTGCVRNAVSVQLHRWRTRLALRHWVDRPVRGSRHRVVRGLPATIDLEYERSRTLPDDEAANLKRVLRYYDRTESRIGYKLLLHGTKHFGWYEPGQSMWQFEAAMRRMEDVLAKRLALPEGASVLDAGCGMGDVARTMASKYGLDVTGIDILDFNIEEARRRSEAAGLEKQTHFQEGDYHALDFANESFDGIYTMETFVHAANPERVLSEFHRVLRPNGHLVMFEYSRTSDEQLSGAASKALRRVCDLGAMPAWYRLCHGELEKVLDGAGFIVDSSEDVTSRMLPMLHAFSTLGRFPYLVGRIIRRTEKIVNAMSGVEMWNHQDAWRYNIYVSHKGTPQRQAAALGRWSVGN
jgi:sterol 24-C-methyltransferase